MDTVSLSGNWTPSDQTVGIGEPPVSVRSKMAFDGTVSKATNGGEICRVEPSLKVSAGQIIDVRFDTGEVFLDGELTDSKVIWSTPSP